MRHAITLLAALLAVAVSSGAVAVGQYEPIVLVTAQAQSCKGSYCGSRQAWGNGVVVDSCSQRMIVATAGHVLANSNNVNVQIKGALYPASDTKYIFNQSNDDFGIIVVSGDFSGVPSAEIYSGEIPLGVQLSVDGYWPAQDKWNFRRYPLRRMMNRLLGDSLDKPITQGVSGAPVMYQGKVAGIVVGIDQPTFSRSTVTFFTTSNRMLYFMNQWGYSPSRSVDDAAPSPLVNATPDRGIQLIPDDGSEEIAQLGESMKSLRDAVEAIRNDAKPVDETPIVIESTPTEPAPEKPIISKAKGWAWDGISGWAWGAAGMAIAGPIGYAVAKVVGGRVHSRVKKRGDSSSGYQGWEPIRNTPTSPSPPPQKTNNESCDCKSNSAQVQKSLDEIMRQLQERETKKQKGGQAHATTFQDSQQAPPVVPKRNLDELSQVVQLSRLEGHDPLLDAAFGLFVRDETEALIERSDVSSDVKKEIEDLLRRVRSRVDNAAPLSVKS